MTGQPTAKLKEITIKLNNIYGWGNKTNNQNLSSKISEIINILEEVSNCGELERGFINRAFLSGLISSDSNLALHLLNNLPPTSTFPEQNVMLNINGKGGFFNATPLIEAVWQNNFDLIVKLLSMGAKVNETDKYGRTALYSAVEKCLPSIVEVLLYNNAATHNMLENQNQESNEDQDLSENPLWDDYGNFNISYCNHTVVHYAACFFNPTILRFLILYGTSSLDQKNGDSKLTNSHRLPEFKKIQDS